MLLRVIQDISGNFGNVVRRQCCPTQTLLPLVAKFLPENNFQSVKRIFCPLRVPPQHQLNMQQTALRKKNQTGVNILDVKNIDKQ